MNKFTAFLAVLASTTIALASTAQASEVSVSSRAYTNSCGYYSNKAADFVVTYKNEMLPATAKVAINYGFDGHDVAYNQGQQSIVPLKWQNPGEVTLTAVAPGVFQATVTGVIANRGASVEFDALAFVVKVTQADGKTIYDTGSEHGATYFKSTVTSKSRCTSTGKSEDAFDAGIVSVVAQ